MINLPRHSIPWLLAETMVVVLGILIAFQLDEWRATRSEQSSVDESLHSLLLDLNEDAIFLGTAIEGYKLQSTAARELLRVLIEPGDPTDVVYAQLC